MKKIIIYDNNYNLSKTCFVFLGKIGAGSRDLARLRLRYNESKFISLRDDRLDVFFKSIFSSNYIIYIHSSPWIIFIWAFLFSKIQFFLVHNTPGFKSNIGFRGLIDLLILYINILIIKNKIFLSKHVAEKYNFKKIFILSNKKFVNYKFNIFKNKINKNSKPTIFFFGRYLPYKNLEKFVELSNMYKNFDFYIYSSGSPFKDTDNLHVVRSWISESEVDRIYEKHDILILPYAETTQSGPFFLGLECNKIIVAPDISGFKEYADYSGLFLYSSKNENFISIALDAAIKKFNPLLNL